MTMHWPINPLPMCCVICIVYYQTNASDTPHVISGVKMNLWHLVRCYIIAGSGARVACETESPLLLCRRVLHNQSHHTVVIILHMADLAWAPADLPQSKLRHAEQEYYSLNNVQCSKHLTALLKHFYPASLCVAISHQIWETFHAEFSKLRRLSENRFSPRTCFCWGKVFDGHKNSGIVQLCFAAENKEFMSRKRKSYLGKVVENSSLLCAVAANVGRQFGEFFNRSLLLLRFNLNLPPLSSQSLFASLVSPFTFSPIFEEKSRCHPWLWVFCVIILFSCRHLMTNFSLKHKND